MLTAPKPILRWLGLQFLMVLVIAALFLMKSPLAAGSALLGGLIYWLPQGYFTLKVFAGSGRRSKGGSAGILMAGEASKLAITMLLFALVFANLEPLDAPALMIAFAVMVVSHWLAPLAVKSPSSR